VPLGRKPPLPASPLAPAEWRPQPVGTQNARSIVDPIVEPGWGGVRVLVRVNREADGRMSATLTDDEGDDATEEFAEIANAIAQAALSDQLIVDGFLTVEATQRSEGRDPPEALSPAKGPYMTHMLLGGKAAVPEADRKIDPNVPIAFVAVDLLLIDGTPLVDLPLAERKRLLDGALTVGEQVRITPFARTPIGSLAQTWYTNGFREMVWKSANGRYNADGKAGDWAAVPLRAR
jgi:ATP-dependent DNA ligase